MKKNERLKFPDTKGRHHGGTVGVARVGAREHDTLLDLHSSDLADVLQLNLCALDGASSGGIGTSLVVLVGGGGTLGVADIGSSDGTLAVLAIRLAREHI